MRMNNRMAIAGLIGGLAGSGAAVTQQPINLLAPTLPPVPSASAIPAAPLPPPTVISAPQTGVGAPPGPTVMTLPMLPAAGSPNYEAAIPYLVAARSSISSRRFATASEALEQAETSLLNDGGTAGPGPAGPVARQALLQVRLARHALAYRDQADALAATGQALASIRVADSEAATAEDGQTARPAGIEPTPVHAQAPAVPVITKALLPGHWQLSGWQYRWVPPETQLRPVDTRSFEPGHYVWRDGAWTWDPGHYGND